MKNKGGRPRAWDETGRRCLDCGEHKPLDQFLKKRSSIPAGVTYGGYCKGCRLKGDNRPDQREATRAATMRRCEHCKCRRPLSAFYSERTRWCTPCRDQSQGKGLSVSDEALHQRWLTALGDRPVHRALMRLRRHNLTPVRYQRILEAQGHACAICRDQVEILHIDHDHSCCPGRSSCGKCIRGLLCWKCNDGLGRFGDDVDLLLEAATYLKAGPAPG